LERDDLIGERNIAEGKMDFSPMAVRIFLAARRNLMGEGGKAKNGEKNPAPSAERKSAARTITPRIIILGLISASSVGSLFASPESKDSPMSLEKYAIPSVICQDSWLNGY